MSRCAEGIDGRLVSSDEQFEKIKDKKPTHIAIYECKDNESPKGVESIILSKYFFEVNISENENSEDKEISVRED